VGILLLFLLLLKGTTFASIVITLVGIFFLACGKYTNCTGTFIDELDDVIGAYLVFGGWWLTGVVVIAMFVISGVLVPLAVVMSDVCVVIEDFPTDMHAYLDKIIVPEKNDGSSSRRTSDTDIIEGEDWWWSSTVSTSFDKKKRLRLLVSEPTIAVGPSPVDILQGCYNKQKLLDSLNMS
jgi:hypothetical protein